MSLGERDHPRPCGPADGSRTYRCRNSPSARERACRRRRLTVDGHGRHSKRAARLDEAQITLAGAPEVHLVNVDTACRPTFKRKLAIRG